MFIDRVTLYVKGGDVFRRWLLERLNEPVVAEAGGAELSKAPETTGAR